ncbi:MAG: hypothetical protein ACXWFF_06925 [Methylomonas sp.]
MNTNIFHFGKAHQLGGRITGILLIFCKAGSGTDLEAGAPDLVREMSENEI